MEEEEKEEEEEDIVEGGGEEKDNGDKSDDKDEAVHVRGRNPDDDGDDDGDDNGDDDDSSYEDNGTDDDHDEDEDLEEVEEDDMTDDEDVSNEDQNGAPNVIEILDDDDDVFYCKAKIIEMGNGGPYQLMNYLVSNNEENRLQGISLCLLDITSEFYQNIKNQLVPNDTKINIGIPSCNVDFIHSNNGNSTATIIAKGNQGTAPLLDTLRSKAIGDNKDLFNECWILLNVTEPFSNSLHHGQKLLEAHLAPPDDPNRPGGPNNPCILSSSDEESESNPSAMETSNLNDQFSERSVF